MAVALSNNASPKLFMVMVTQDFTGNATLAGPKGIVFNLEPDNDDNYTVTTEEYEEQEELTPYIPAVPATYDEYGNELNC